MKAAEPCSRSRGEPGTPQRERARDRKEGAGQPGRERPREASRQPGRSHFLPQVSFQVQLPLEDLGAILRLIRLLLQALDLPLHRFQGARRGHGRGAGGGQGAEVLHVAARGPAPFNGPMTSRGWRWRWGGGDVAQRSRRKQRRDGRAPGPPRPFPVPCPPARGVPAAAPGPGPRSAMPNPPRDCWAPRVSPAIPRTPKTGFGKPPPRPALRFVAALGGPAQPSEAEPNRSDSKTTGACGWGAGTGL